MDEFLHAQLMASAVSMVVRLLRKDGTFVAKVFAEPHTPSTDMLLAQLRRLFRYVELAKPPSSRASSAEHFVVCMGFFGTQKSIPTLQQEFLGDLSGYNAT